MAQYPNPDQVPRRQAFEREHPDVTITPPDSASPGSYGQWAAWQDGKVVASAYELKDLLDQLEEHQP